jgi:hypothetical protein
VSQRLLKGGDLVEPGAVLSFDQAGLGVLE